MPFAQIRLAAAAALAFSLACGAAAPAVAQGIDASSLGDQGTGSLVTAAVGSVNVGSLAGALDTVGSAEMPLDSGSMNTTGTPRPVDPSITETRFIKSLPSAGAYEYWLVASAAMHREVVVEVVPARGTGPAPVLYLLDGVDSPEGHSGWRSMAKVADRMANENVHVVSPTGAYASNWTDWESADPVLGFNKWETFLTKELPGLVAERLNTSGKSAIGGISMGGQAAMHLAATYPELYSGVMSFSGNYSTMDPRGRQSVRMTVESRGGAIGNMWGPFGSPQWQANDTISHPEGLRDQAVYFSAGNGVVGPEDAPVYKGKIDEMAAGLVLELGVHESTLAFERSLTLAGIAHQVDYSQTGLHNWVNFLKNFDAGWAHIKPALQG